MQHPSSIHHINFLHTKLNNIISLQPPLITPSLSLPSIYILLYSSHSIHSIQHYTCPTLLHTSIFPSQFVHWPPITTAMHIAKWPIQCITTSKSCHLIAQMVVSLPLFPLFILKTFLSIIHLLKFWVSSRALLRRWTPTITGIAACFGYLALVRICEHRPNSA